MARLASIALKDLKARVRCEAGLFWARLVFPIETGTREFGGYPKQPAVSFTEEVNGRLRRYAVQQLEKASAPLREVAGRIDTLLGGGAYARNSQRTATVSAAEAALAVTSHDFWADFATQEQRKSAEAVSDFVANSKRLVKESNKRFVKAELGRYAEFFDTIESKPLTQAQRKACVISEDNNLVLAGAGTGKTSTMMGRAGYLLAAERVEPEQLLMLAYGRKAAGEMQERQDSRLAPWLDGGSPKIKTFHALGLEIIGKAEGRRPDVSPMVEDPRAYAAFITSTIDQLCDKRAYRRRLIRYLGTAQYPYRSPFDFATLPDYFEYVRTNELRTLTGQLVKSYEEVIVANFLTLSGIAYEYEAPYEVETAGPDYRQYRPDFFLTEHGIYIEHFALDEDGNPPEHFGPARYLEGVAWKRALHEKHGTTLIETYSYEQRNGELETLLEEKLLDAGVKIDPRADEEILEDLRKTSLVSDFGVLMGQFLNLFKQSGTTMRQLKASVAQHEDAERLELLVELFAPVFEGYQSHLKAHGQIDFHDMIHRATEHVRSGRYSSPFTHLMVDEFQDISAPRADLVKALREQRDDSVVFTVGDDWQAIYRFAGSDIGFTRDFKKHFGTTVTTALDTTFRFNDKIGQVSSTFVLQNPAQMDKTIGSLTRERQARGVPPQGARDGPGPRAVLGSSCRARARRGERESGLSARACPLQLRDRRVARSSVQAISYARLPKPQCRVLDRPLRQGQGGRLRHRRRPRGGQVRLPVRSTRRRDPGTPPPGRRGLPARRGAAPLLRRPHARAPPRVSGLQPHGRVDVHPRVAGQPRRLPDRDGRVR